MSCIHNVWNCYCKRNEEVLEKPCSPLCKNYCNEETSMKNIFNKGPATTTNCACNESTADNDYVSMLEMFINKLYTDTNHGFFGLTAFQAEKRTEEDMLYLGYNAEMVNKACVDTMNNFKSKNNAPLYRLKCFVNDMLSKPHRNYIEKYPFEFRFVLTLILGYLGKLDSIAIINCDNPETYFEDIVNSVTVSELAEAIDKVRLYAKESNAIVLAEGMRRFEAWFEEPSIKIIPPKELTIKQIEELLGYKIKIVGDDK